MIRSKTAMGFLWALLALVLHVVPGAVGPAHAQGSRKDDIVFNTRGTPLSGATVRVCAMPASGQPCTPLALIYSDPGLTQALANPTTTDGLGNYFFYAAPGRYEIEISGPGITAKQIPNVILPSDPSSPTFNSLSTSGGISAFSLNLTGNLSVNGNTTVIGNLASGTLNLTNQSTPPGAGGSGTVNLYTKTADKRLYYKDDGGTEIGPLGPGNGAQTNVTNTFTAPQNIDADFHTKGPNPVYDVTRYGGYLGTNPPPATTGSINSGTTALNLASAQDFANGHGILILGAGPATALSTPNMTSPSTATVTPKGVTGSSTYNYCIVAEDYANGRTACSTAISTATGVATLGLQSTITGVSCARASGIVTCTTPGNHNLVANSQVNVCGTSAACGGGGGTGDHTFEGAFSVASIPSGTTFTYYQYGQPDVSGTVTAGTVQVNATNFLQWNIVPYSVLRSYIYRCPPGSACTLPANAANYALAGVAQGMDSSFTDYGFAIAPSNIGNGDVPATAPTSATAQWLSTTITAGGGTTSLTLANAAGSTVAGATVLHDNTPNVKAACAASNAYGSTVFVPAVSDRTLLFTINSTLNLSPCSGGSELTLDLGPVVVLNGTIIPGNFTRIKGEPTGFGMSAQTFYSFGQNTSVSGHAYPLFYILPGTTYNTTFAALSESCSNPYQSCSYHDEDSTGNNSTSIRYSDVHFKSNQKSTPVVLKGGFGFFFEYGGWATNGSGFNLPPGLLMTPNCGLGNVSQQLPGIVYFDKTYNFGGMVIDSCGLNATNGNHMEFKEMLGESLSGPFLRVNAAATGIAGLNFISPTYADYLGGAATPVLDFGTSTSVSGITAYNIGIGNGAQPIFAGQGIGTQIIEGGTSGTNTYISRQYAGSSSPSVAPANTNDLYVNAASIFTGTGKTFYQIATPAAPPSVALASGGSLSVGQTYYYYVQANDAFNAASAASQAGPVCTPTTGNQKCVVTFPALVAGQTSWTVCRNTNNFPPINAVCSNTGQGFQVPTSTATFTDDGSASFSGSQLGNALGMASGMSSNGLNTPQFTLTGGGFKSTLTGSFTANRSVTQPDVNGINEVSGYQNSAYDNFNRANGALGSNWTVVNGTLAIASNLVGGTTGGVGNISLWNANSFYSDQFCEVTVTNISTGVTGCVMRASGSTYYACAESTTNMYFQKTGSNMTITGITGANGDVVRGEVAGTTVNCYQNGALINSTTDSSYTSGSPGIFLFSNTAATADNWSGGNLHPFAHLDTEQDWVKLQHFNSGISLAGETFTASPRGMSSAFLPGALTSTWTGATWTPDKAITITRVQVQAKTAPASCTTNAVVRLTDGTTPVNVTIVAAANDSGAITQNYAAGASLTVSVQTAAAGCGTSPADVNVTIQYRMQ